MAVALPPAGQQYGASAPFPFGAPPGGATYTPAQGYDSLGNPQQAGVHVGSMSDIPAQYQTPNGTSLPSNPYLAGTANEIQRQTQLGLQDAFNQIRSNDVATGGYGGTREGVAQGVAMGQAMGSLQGQLAQLYGGAYENQANRGLQEQGLNQNYALGLGNLGLGFTNAGNQFALGVGGLANQRYGTDVGAATQRYLGDQNYNLGVGNLGLGYTNAGNQYALGLGGLANQRYGTDLNYNLGMGNLGLGYTQAANNYNLGLGNLGLGYTQAQNNYNLGLGGLANQRYGQDQNFYTAQRGQDLQQTGLGAELYGLGLQNGWTGLNNASNIYNNTANQSGSNNASTSQGGGGMGAIGGAIGGATLMNALSGNPYGGYFGRNPGYTD